MWKKDDDTTEKSTRDAAQAAPKSPGGSAGSAGSSGRTATIGSAIRIHGEVSGDEDLLIQGHVDGSIDLKEHSVTIGGDGKVTASINARVVTVEGRVDGDIRGRERVVLRSSSEVNGDITSPRVVLEDGARFRGGIDMGDARASSGDSRSGTSKSGSGSPSSGSGVGGASADGERGASGSKSGSSSSGSSSSERSTAGSAGSSGSGAGTKS